jgi:hypothetical protein
VATVAASPERDDFRDPTRERARQELMAALLRDACARHTDKLALVGGPQGTDCRAVRDMGDNALVVWECQRALEQDQTGNMDNLRVVADTTLAYAVSDRALEGEIDRHGALETFCGAQAIALAADERGWEPTEVSTWLADNEFHRLARLWLTGRDPSGTLMDMVNPSEPD